MSLFASNPELRACFESDAISLIYQLQANLEILTKPEPAPDRLATFQELAHTLRGAAALVEIPEIADVCSDFMRLGEVADSCKHTAWDKAGEILQFVQGSLDSLLQAVIHALAGEDGSTAALCQTIQSKARERWKDYFYDGNVTEAEGGFHAYHSVPDSEPAAAGEQDCPVSNFLSEVETAAPTAPEPETGSAAAADFLGAVVPATGAAPAQGHDEAVEFLASMEEAPANTQTDLNGPAPEAASPEAGPSGTAAEDFLSAVETATEPAAGQNQAATDDFLAAMDDKPAVPGTPAEAGDSALKVPAAEAESIARFLEDASQAPALSLPAVEPILDPELLPYFFEDALINLEAIEPALAAWETNQDAPAALQSLHRHIHTIKGAARTSGLESLGLMANAVEDLVEDAMEGRLVCPAEALAALVRRMSEVLKAAIGELRSRTSLVANRENIAAVLTEAEALRRGEIPAASATAEPAEQIATAAATPAVANSGYEADLLPFFYEDAYNNLDSLEESLHNWEEDPEQTASLQAVYRNTHTIKGAANSTGLAEMGRMIHTVEDLLEDCLAKKVQITPAALASLIYEMVDGIKAGIRELQAQSAFDTSLAIFTAISGKADTLRATKPQTKSASRRRKRQAAEAPADPAEAAPVAAAPAVKETAPVLPAAPVEVPAVVVPEPVEAVESPAEAEVAQREPAAAAESPESQTIRVNAQRLDAMMNLIGELIISRTRLDKKILDIARLKGELNFCKTRLLEAIGNIHERFEYSQRSMRTGRRGGNDLAALGLDKNSPPAEGITDGFSDLEFDRYDEFNIMARSLVETGNDISEVISQLDRFFGSFSEESSQFNKTTTNLQNEVTRIRMVPLTFLFRRLQRAVRDAAVRESKEVDFQIGGAETQLDKNIVDEIYSPLLHLVRNSVSHGIENVETRDKAGKPARGRVSVRAYQESNQVVIEVSDDGGGLNYAAIRATALERGLIAPDAQPTEEELTQLIFRAGFSTSKSVSQVSGRGVGMNVVANVVARLNGGIEVRSNPGTGTTFILHLPLTLAINQAMMVSVSGSKYALPLSFVEHIVPYRQENLILSGDRELWRTENASLPLVRLDRVFGLPAADTQHANVVLVRVANKSLALLVEEQLTRQDIVVKPLGSLLATTNFYSGATLSGDGDVILILDLPAIERGFRGTAKTEARATEPARKARLTVTKQRRGTVLVVDDSLSVRKVAEKYLAAVGYDSVLAVDGLDALEKLRASGEVHAVLTDLEMPRMHGFELIAELRQNANYRDLPVIVVTSRDAEKHRRRATELGANGYITKPFTREQLAERLDALITTTANA